MINAELVQLVKTFLTGHKTEQERIESPSPAQLAVFDKKAAKGYYCFTWRTSSGDKCVCGTEAIAPRRISKFVKHHHCGGGPSCLREICMSNATSGAEWKPVVSRDIQRLSCICPHLREVSLNGFSFGAAHRKRRIKLRDFPKHLVSLSLRNCVLDMKTFLSAGLVENSELTALDLGRCFFLNDNKSRSKRRVAWPLLPLLERLCLEGCPFLISEALLSDVLLGCPSLQVLDLEGTSLQSTVDVALIGRCLPKLRELFIGWTDVNDSSFLALERGYFDELVTLCLVGTHVTNLGVLAVCGICPRLRTIRVTMGRWAVRKLERVDVCHCVSIEIVCFRSDNVHAFIRHEGCEHFREHAKRSLT
ncbi:uncharacterized protein LOC119401906 [Rhipicephalus sanguineus]|uniref:uncharacterized protein LOC119401906 n=1 Tax=Rhipicephalus sanguineus TaxID=34632 RepID=UPI0018933F73|nr:uncharacterized protein LOC119401906 [Rhipicephalus sanguineus]